MDILFDLQLFAANTQTTLLNSVGNDLSPENKTYYDMRLIDYAEPNLVHNQFGQKRPIPERGGKTIEFRKFDMLPKALKPITEGVTPDGQALNVEAITAQIDQYGAYVTLSDILDLTAIDPVMEETVKLLGSQAGRTLDTVTRDIINAGTNVLYAGGKSSRAALTTSDLIDEDLIFEAAAILKGQNAPVVGGNGYVAIVHPYIAYDIMRASKSDGSWTDVNKYAHPEAIFNGELGKLGNVRFVESTEAKIFYGADLCSDSRTLAINYGSGYTGATSIVVDGGTFAADELVGRYIIVNGYKAKITGNTASSGTSTLTLDTAVTAVNDAVIYPGEGASDGSAVFSTLIVGADAYGVTEVSGGGLETVIKPFGSGDDPLNQRATAGWKATAVAERLIETYMVRIESSCSLVSKITEAN